jgi:hypothetical protein
MNHTKKINTLRDIKNITEVYVDDPSDITDKLTKQYEALMIKETVIRDKKITIFIISEKILYRKMNTLFYFNGYSDLPKFEESLNWFIFEITGKKKDELDYNVKIKISELFLDTLIGELFLSIIEQSLITYTRDELIKHNYEIEDVLRKIK